MFHVRFQRESSSGHHWKDHGEKVLTFVPFIGMKIMETGANFEVVDVAWDCEDDVFNVYLRRL